MTRLSGIFFSVQHLVYAYSTSVTSLVQDLVTGISHPSDGVSAIKEQKVQNTALLTQTNNTAIAAASSLTDQINQTADTFDRDGSGSGFGSGPGSERLTSNAYENSFEGTSGDSTLIVAEGNLSLIGSVKNQALDGGDGDNALDVGDGNDVTLGKDDVDSLLGEVGSDVLSGGAGNELLNGNDGNDAFAAESAIDTQSANGGSSNLVDVTNGTLSMDDDDFVDAFTFDNNKLLGALP